MADSRNKRILEALKNLKAISDEIENVVSLALAYNNSPSKSELPWKLVFTPTSFSGATVAELNRSAVAAINDGAENSTRVYPRYLQLQFALGGLSMAVKELDSTCKHLFERIEAALKVLRSEMKLNYGSTSGSSLYSPAPQDHLQPLSENNNKNVVGNNVVVPVPKSAPSC